MNLLAKIQWNSLLGENIRPETIKTVNRYLAIAAGCLLIFILWDAFSNSAGKSFKKMVFEARQSASLDDGIKIQPKLADESVYKTAVSEKMLFKASSGLSSGTSASTEAAVDVLKDIVLVGMIKGDSPQAILEDQKTQKTYYLSQGQSSNGVTADEVSDNAVTLSAQGQTKKITL